MHVPFYNSISYSDAWPNMNHCSISYVKKLDPQMLKLAAATIPKNNAINQPIKGIIARIAMVLQTLSGIRGVRITPRISITTVARNKPSDLYLLVEHAPDRTTPFDTPPEISNRVKHVVENLRGIYTKPVERPLPLSKRFKRLQIE